MLWNRLEDDGTYHMTNWTLPRLLAILNDAPFTDEQALWPPTGIWRCVEIRPDQDDEHTTHQNCVHSAANTWLYNNAVVDDQTGDRTYLADTLTGWDWAGRGWRTVSKFDRPSR